LQNLIDIPKEKNHSDPVDFMGMGDPIQKYNEHLEQIKTGLYTNSGTQELLREKDKRYTQTITDKLIL
jgi:hypothetical protein